MTAFFASLFGPRFWIPGYISLALGFLLPGDWQAVRWSIPYWLGGILFFTCLKMPLAEVVHALTNRRRWTIVSGISCIKLLLLPAIGWTVTWLIEPRWAPGMALVCAMPAGLSSIAFTDILRGNHILALMVAVATSLLCALSVPLVMRIADPGGPQMSISELIGQAGYIISLLAIPFFVAQIVRALLPGLVQRYHHRWSIGAVACSCVLGMVSVLCNRALWHGWPLADLWLPLGLTIALTGVALATGWLSRRVLVENDSTAFTCGLVYMNNGLAVAFAMRFYHDQAAMVLPAVLMQFPIIGAVALIRRVVPQAVIRESDPNS